MQNKRQVRAIGAPLTHTAAAAFGSSKPSGVDRHGPPLAGLHGRAVGWAVVGERTAVGHSNRVIYTALTACRISPASSHSYSFSFLCRSYHIGPVMHSQLFGGVVGMGSLRTNITCRTGFRLSRLRHTVWAGSARLLWHGTWIMSRASLLQNIITTLREKLATNGSNIQNVTCYANIMNCVDTPTYWTLIRRPAWDPLHIGLSRSPRIWAEGSPWTGFTLVECSRSRKGPLSACGTKYGRSEPTAPVTWWATTVGVVCKPCKKKTGFRMNHVSSPWMESAWPIKFIKKNKREGDHPLVVPSR